MPIQQCPSKSFLSYLIAVLIGVTGLQGAASTPYAPESVGITPGGQDMGNFTYDSAGNRLDNGLTGALEQQIEMGLLTKPESVERGGNKTRIQYAPGGSRYLRHNQNGSKAFYLGNGQFEYRIDATTGKPQAVVNIRAKGYSSIAQVDVSNPDAITYNYVIQDHLGSGLCAVNEQGNAVRTRRYDAWGR